MPIRLYVQNRPKSSDVLYAWTFQYRQLLDNFFVEHFGYQLLCIDSDALTNSMFLDDQIHGRKKIIACFFTKVRHCAVANMYCNLCSLNEATVKLNSLDSCEVQCTSDWKKMFYYIHTPVLYTVALKATFGNMNSAIWAVGRDLLDEVIFDDRTQRWRWRSFFAVQQQETLY